VERRARPSRRTTRSEEDGIATSVTLKLRSPAEAIQLFGRNDENLKLLRRRLGAKVVARGDEVRLSGEADDVAEAERTFRSLLGTIRSGGDVSLTELEHGHLVGEQAESPEETAETTAEAAEIRLPGRHRPKTVGQRRYVSAIARHPITFGIGPAGTGKTYLAVAMAVQALLEKRVKRIVLTRPAVEAGEKLGFLPGDLQAKIDPYLRPLYDALYDMLPADRAEQYLDSGVVEVAPLAFMRGRTLNDAFIILDEAQNTTGEQMKMFLTRMGFGSTVVVTGDVTQTDLPGSVDSGLRVADRILSGIEGIAFVTFDKGDVVRHPLVAQIIRAYEQVGRS
jgi:phosphate starvation-inducible PhoH-like protein